MELTKEHELMLASLSKVQRSPKAYNDMLENLPDDVKRTFVELDVGAVREYSVRSVKRRLRDNSGMAKLLDEVAVRKIIEQVDQNILEDQRKVKEMIGQSSGGVRDRFRVVRR